MKPVVDVSASLVVNVASVVRVASAVSVVSAVLGPALGW